MEHYIVSARKYRPMTFKSVVGQDALTATLKNAIATNHLAHAYLFCGPRGVGKTTCARIFAKTINCLHPKADGEACDECDSCRAFNEQGSFNIHELDAASNNSVDDIRSLVDQVRIPPPIGKYSVYIVDEVHMLSTAAFNAFLKTLEEPPAHAIFILATTEKHKIIPTILSRCQIYNFNRIRVSDTVEYLKYVADNENIKYEDAALTVIAQKADGAMRDALSIFDQVNSFCAGNITYKGAIENLNVLDYDYYFKLVECFLANDAKNTLLIFNDILAKGFDAQYFVSGLSQHLRDVLICHDPITLPLLEVGESIAEMYKAQAAKTPVGFIYKALELANECDMNYRLSKNKRLLVEIMLLRLCNIANKGGEDSKKDKPELPKIAVATAPVTTDNATARTASTAPITNQPKSPALKPVKVVTVSLNAILNKQQNADVPASSVEKNALSEIGGQQSSRIDAVGQSAPSVSSHENKPFTDDRFYEAWMAFAATLTDQAHTMQTMRNFPPVRLHDNEFEMVLANSTQLESMQQLKRSVEKYLSETLSNDTISISFRIAEKEFASQAFTPYEKFVKMQEKNRYFKELKNALGLEL